MEILKLVMALCEVGHTCFAAGQMRRRSVGYVFLSSRAPDAAQRFFSGALQSRGPVAGCVVWLSGSRFCAATLVRCSAPGTRERPRRARKGPFKLRDVRELTTGELSSTAPESRRTGWTNACVLTA